MPPSRPQLLENRLIAFGDLVMLAVRRLPRDAPGGNVARQLVRSSDAPAVLYAEAREAESNADYIHKMKVAVKELRESAVWIEKLKSASGGHIDPSVLRRECIELIAIFVTCIKKARDKP